MKRLILVGICVLFLSGSTAHVKKEEYRDPLPIIQKLSELNQKIDSLETALKYEENSWDGLNSPYVK